MPDHASMTTLGLLMFAGSVLTGAALLAMFLGTAQHLGDDASQAAGVATDELLPGVDVRSVTGHRLPGAPALDGLDVTLAVSGGRDSLPLRSLVLQVRAPARQVTFSLANESQAFTWHALLDAEPAMDASDPALSPGDLVEVTLDTAGAGVPLPPRTDATLVVVTPHARIERVAIHVPVSFEGRDVLELHSVPAPAPRWVLVRQAVP